MQNFYFLGWFEFFVHKSVLYIVNTHRGCGIVFCSTQHRTTCQSVTPTCDRTGEGHGIVIFMANLNDALASINIESLQLLETEWIRYAAEMASLPLHIFQDV